MNLELELHEVDQTPKMKAWWGRVAALGCIVTGQPNPTLHHIHGGSVADIGAHTGMGQRGVHDYLVIPLAAQLHCVGCQSIDGPVGVRTWELRFGTQVDLMDEVCRRTGHNAWMAAGIWRDPWEQPKSERPRLRSVR